ncbi:MAG TPA: diphthamide synthesis protein [Candidatus Nanoarchaeia archaeon]|nr:diphthamide synthesis protein [Candidatus Nanoarchaeia archaeon]
MSLTLNLELEKAVEKINAEKAKLVCIQLPDGLKPRADDIKKELEQKTQATIVFWSGSCFGACDVPVGLEKLGVDLIIQFGHTHWMPKLKGYEYG